MQPASVLYLKPHVDVKQSAHLPVGLVLDGLGRWGSSNPAGRLVVPRPDWAGFWPCRWVHLPAHRIRLAQPPQLVLLPGICDSLMAQQMAPAAGVI